MAVAVAVALPFLSNKRRWRSFSSLSREITNETVNVTPYSSFEERRFSPPFFRKEWPGPIAAGEGSLTFCWIVGSASILPRNSTPEIIRGIMFKLNYGRKYGLIVSAFRCLLPCSSLLRDCTWNWGIFWRAGQNSVKMIFLGRCNIMWFREYAI